MIAKLDPTSNAIKPRDVPATLGWRSWLHLPEPTALDNRAQLLSRAAKSIKITPTPHTRVLEVSIDSQDPKLAADFANTLVSEFILQNVEARWDTTQRTSECEQP